MPFFLSLPQTSQQAEAIIHNGAQWFSAKHSWDKARVSLNFPLYRTKLTAKLVSDGVLEGRFESDSKTWGGATLILKGRAIPGPDRYRRFFPEAQPTKTKVLPNRWTLKFAESGEGTLTLTKGESGYDALVLQKSGNSIHLSGALRGRRLMLSGFDGTSPYLLTLRVGEQSMIGQWVAGQDMSWRESVRGFPNPNAKLERPIVQFDSQQPLALAELDASPYSGAPVAVLLVGSWCAHCKDALEYFKRAHKKFSAAGLQVLVLDFEFTQDKAFNAEQASLLQRRFGLPWPVMPKHGSIDDFWKLLPKGLSGSAVPEFPLLVLLDRQKRVRGTHAGFVGPSDPIANRALTEKLDAWLGALVANDSAQPTAPPPP